MFLQINGGNCCSKHWQCTERVVSYVHSNGEQAGWLKVTNDL